MKYYDISDGYKYKKVLFGGEQILFNKLRGGGKDLLREGKYIENWDERNKLLFDDFEIAEERPPVFLSAPVVSEKIKISLEEKGITGIQYLPIKFEHKNNADYVINGYYVMNILNILDEDVINKEKSEIGPFGVCVSANLYEDKIKGYDIFRIKGEEVSYFVSEKFKKAISDIVKKEVIFRKIELT